MTLAAVRPDAEPTPTADHSTSVWSSTPIAVVVLVVVSTALSLLGSPDGYLSTDVGGKTAALEAMDVNGVWSTDIGYWAEDHDPNGAATPFAHTSFTASGWWVNTTSLPMVLAARPLWMLGGAQLILLLPALGAAGAAVVAGRLQEQLRPGSGRTAMWVVGLASPLTVYALDFWEHSIGVFLMALGALLVLRIAAPVDGGALPVRRAMVLGLLAGGAFGFAATMRQEAMVYGFVAGLTLVGAGLASARRSPGARSVLAALAPGGTMAGAALATLVANSLVEAQLYGEVVRSSRSVRAASAAGGGVGERIDAAFTITLSPINAIHPIATVFGLLLAAALTWLVVEARNGGDVRRPAFVAFAVALVLALRVVQSGPTFVPGLVPAAPLAIAGLAFGLASRRHRLLAIMAVGPLPLVYLTQYTAGAVPQWGGRYILTTGVLLTVLACAELPRRNLAVFRGLVVAAALVTASGVWFNAERTRSVAADVELIEQVSDGDVVVWFDPFKARETGPAVVGERWLSTYGGVEISTVEGVLEAEAIDRFVHIDPIDDPVQVFEGFAPVSEIGEWELGPILGQRLTIYERTTG